MFEVTTTRSASWPAILLALSPILPQACVRLARTLVMLEVRVPTCARIEEISESTLLRGREGIGDLRFVTFSEMSLEKREAVKKLFDGILSS